MDRLSFFPSSILDLPFITKRLVTNNGESGVGEVRNGSGGGGGGRYETGVGGGGGGM